MKYKVTHTTAYNYESPVRVCHNLVMLSPRNDGPVRVQKHHLKISPRPQVMHAREDFFGNQMHAFSVEESHRQLKVTSVSRLRVLQHKPVKAEETRPWESIVEAISSGTDPRWISAAPFQFDSRKIQRSDTFREYALMDFTPGRPILLCALELMNRIHTEFKYDPAATFVNTLPHEVFAIKRGVCQDFAQVGISALRSIGLSARYVSGYLRTVPPEGKERLIGADQSHAWISLYCGPETGWVDMDPTNDCICATDHIPIAWGRDYQDVVPVRGVFLGGGQHTLSVSVDVVPVE